MAQLAILQLSYIRNFLIRGHTEWLPRCANSIAFKRGLSNRFDRNNSESSDDNTDLVKPKETSQHDVPEEEYSVSAFARNELVPEKPIKSLDLLKDVIKVEKKGSFSVDIFTGNYDPEFLLYPEAVKNRLDTQYLKNQAKMVEQMWPQIWNDQRQLQKFNFFNLYKLSISEMMTIFEAIGSSTRQCYDNQPCPKESNVYNQSAIQALVSQSILSLVIRNCLTYWPMSKSDNFNITNLIPKTNLSFGDPENSKKIFPPIAFCWTEQAPTLGSLPPQEWSTMGQNGGNATNHHLITGKKQKVLAEEGTEHYLVYFRDKFLSEKYHESTPTDEPNPASDPFVGACLLHKSEIKLSAPYTDVIGFKYNDIELDISVAADRVVFPARRKDPMAVNVKALGQVATCSVTLGILKDSLRRAYKYLLDHKQGLLSCDIVQRKLAGVTSKIFAIESMVYYIAGMYDGLEDGFDAHMEATILKILCNEYSYDITRELQHVCGSEMMITSKFQDQINIFDSFLDGNIYNRLYLATMGVLWFARSRNMELNQLRLAPWYPGYFVKSMLREHGERYDFLTLNADIYGHIHPSLREAGENLEFILKRVSYATKSLCMKHGKDVTGAQTDLYRLSSLSIDAFQLTAMIARASKSYCNGSRNSELDVGLATNFSRDLLDQVRLYMEELNTNNVNVLSSRAPIIHEMNMKHGGYYAESPLDSNV